MKFKDIAIYNEKCCANLKLVLSLRYKYNLGGMQMLSKMLKKVCAVVLMMVLVLSMVACAPKESGTSEGDGTASKKLPTVVWYNIGDAPAALEATNARLSELVRDEIGANIEVRFIGYGDYDQKMSTMLAAGDDMDLLFTANWAASFTQNALDGYFVDLYTLEEYLSETIDLVNPALKLGATFDGALYGISTNKEVGWDNYLYYVQEEVDFLDTGEVKVPLTERNRIEADGDATEVTFAEYLVQERLDIIDPVVRQRYFLLPLIDAAADAYRALGVNVVSGNTNLSDPNYVTVMPATFETHVRSVLGGLDPVREAANLMVINVFDKNASEYKLIVDPEFEYYEEGKEGGREYDKLIRDGDIRLIPVDEASFNGRDHRFLIETRGAFPFWNVQLSNDYSTEGNVKTMKELSYYPVWTGGTDPGVVTVIPVQSKNKEAAAMFLELLNTNQEVRTTAAYGVEGVHWNYIDYTDEITGESFTAEDKVYFERTEVGQKDYNVGVYTQGNFFVLPLQKGEPANKWEVFHDKYTPNTTGELPYEGLNFSASTGFRPDLTSPEMQSSIAALQTEFDKHNLFYHDTNDFDDKWDAFESLKDNESIQALVDEINRQFAEFLNSK